MNAKDGASLLVLSAIWGGAFLFIRIASPVLGPVALVELRVLIAGIVLLLYVLAIRKPLDLKARARERPTGARMAEPGEAKRPPPKARWRHYLIVGLLNSAIPFVLISTAELHLTAGLTAILNATSPLFGAIVAAIWIKEALTANKIIGLLLGLIGVAVLVGWSPIPFSAIIALSIAASLTGAAFYGLAGVYTKVNTQGASPLALATCSQLGAALFLAPFTIAAPPQHTPTQTVILAVVTLGILCTAVAYLLYFRLIANIGPTRALTVTFLVPFFGVFWGILFLHEPLTWSTILGFVIILSGTGFVTGILGARKTPRVPAEPPAAAEAEVAR